MRSDYIRISHNLEDMFIYIPVAVGVAVADLFSKLVGSTTVASDISKSEKLNGDEIDTHLEDCHCRF